MAVAQMVKHEDVETLRDDIAVSDIFMEEAYGRPLVQTALERLIAAWDRQRVGVIYLSLRADGTFACLDGWHRVCACRTVEGEHATLPARVYIDLDIQDEAELFAAFNKDRKALKPAELFRSRLAANEPAAHEIHDVVTGLGMDFAWDGQVRDGVITAVAAVEKVYNRLGAKALREVLLTLRNCMGTDAGAIQSWTITGLAQFLVRYGPVADRARLYEVLSRTPTPRLVGQAHGIRSLSPGTAMDVAVGMAILGLYNEKLRGKGVLPPWAARGLTEETRIAMGERGRAQLIARHNGQAS